MKSVLKSACCLAVLTLAAGPGFADNLVGPTTLPAAPPLPTGDVQKVDYDELMSVKALDHYSEPDWVTKLVEAGKLPPVQDRLPTKPIVMNMDVAPDGVGVYGGVLRHVTGGRPEGWNWDAGQHQGWGGLTMTAQECLVSTGPMWELSDKKIEPLPDLATSWEWSKDGHQLTMHLLEGAKWSDGQPFSADDVMFYWNDNVLDPQVPARITGDTLGKGTTLEKVDANTIRFTFPQAFAVANLYKLAYLNFCPGPEHILKPLHPKYNADATYDSYVKALKPEQVPWVTMGPWVVTQYSPDQYVVARRNPYYFKVDNKGNQLPYLDEVQWRLSTWEDRDVQTLAGNADWTNMENPSIYLQGVRGAQDKNSPNKLYWGPRSLNWRLEANMSKTCGAQDADGQAIRDLNRKLDFRRALTQALDRQAMGQALVRGPFTAPYPGGINPESGVFNTDAIAYYPYSPETSKTLLAGLGFKDTDGDGILNWTSGPLAGQNLDLDLHFTSQRTTDVALADSVVAMLHEVGIRAVPKPAPTLMDPVRDSCEWSLMIDRGDRSYQVPITNLDTFAPVTYNVPVWHRGTPDRPQELLPFEKKLVELVDAIRAEPDSQKRTELFSELDHVFTENVYQIGLIDASSAMIVNNRFKNVVPGTPVLAYQFAEKGAMRERFWIPKAEQSAVPELQPGVLPGISK
ncbi:MAG TPA: ABC transporter substrate-binding protein [Devosiaceae bacterium]